MVEIACQTSVDDPAIEDLLDRAFGPDRMARPSYRLREGVAPLTGLGLVARDGGKLVGILRFWPIAIGGAARALLLGPLAVEEAYRRRAIASSLIERGLEGAGPRTIIAVGDLYLFGRFGFTAATPRGLVMPGLADGDRLLVRGASDAVAGCLSQALDEID